MIKTARSRFVQSGFTKGEMAGLLAACVIAIGAFLTFGRPNPTMPALTTPDAGANLKAEATDTDVMFEWNHGGAGRSTGGLPKRVSHFLICAYPANSSQECRLANDLGLGDPPDYASFVKAGDLDRTALQNVPVAPGGDPAYAYSHVMTLPQSIHELPLKWTVGACAAKTTRSCTFAEPRFFELRGRNMVAAGISDNPLTPVDPTDPGTVDFDVAIDSTGNVDTGPFNHQTSVWEILVDNLGNPLTDVNGLMNGSLQAHNWPEKTLEIEHAVILEDGTVTGILLLDLIAGEGEGETFRDDSKVWAIIKPGGVDAFWWAAHPGIPAATTGLKYKPCRGRSRNPPALCRITVPPGPRPTAFAAALWIDSNNFVSEFNESDNHVKEKNIVLQ